MQLCDPQKLAQSHAPGPALTSGPALCSPSAISPLAPRSPVALHHYPFTQAFPFSTKAAPRRLTPWILRHRQSPLAMGPDPGWPISSCCPWGTGPDLEEKGHQRGESGRGKPGDWKGGFWVGFPSRFEAERGVHRVMSCVARPLGPDLGGIKIKREQPEAFPFLNPPVFRLVWFSLQNLVNFTFKKPHLVSAA